MTGSKQTLVVLAAGALPHVAIRLTTIQNGMRLVVALGLIIARAFWDQSGVVFIPTAFFWLWVIVTSVVLIRRAGDGE